MAGSFYLQNPPAGCITGGLARTPIEQGTAELGKSSHTDQALAALEKTSARLSALVAELERRLCMVLLSTPPTNGTEEGRGQWSSLVEKLFNEESVLRSTAERLDSIISRIDL